MLRVEKRKGGKEENPIVVEKASCVGIKKS
jgi:hypothetical protein